MMLDIGTWDNSKTYIVPPTPVVLQNAGGTRNERPAEKGGALIVEDQPELMSSALPNQLHSESTPFGGIQDGDLQGSS